MLQAVILDFGGVLFSNKSDYLGPKGNLKVDPNNWNKAGLGEIEDLEIFQEIADNYSVDIETVKSWLFSRREPNKKLLELLKKLKPEIKKVVINNGLKSLFRGFFEKYPEAVKPFDLLINSAEEGVKKPDAKIYLDTCEKLGVDPKNCLMIDDDRDNLEGAKKIGMEIVFFEDIERLEEEFRRLQLIN